MNAHRTGLTLIETMVAFTVLVVGTFAVFDALVTAKRTHERATNMALAYQEIQAQIETVQYLPYLSMQTTFKGSSFSVPGLGLQTGRTMSGTVTKLANPNPYSTMLGSTNPNRFTTVDQTMPLRFRVDWLDSSGPCTVELIYVLSFRGI